MATTVAENASAERYEIHVDGALAGFVEYRGSKGRRALTHTEIDPAYEGQGLGSRLVKEALEDLRRRELELVPLCSFVRSYVDRHPEYDDLVA